MHRGLCGKGSESRIARSSLSIARSSVCAAVGVCVLTSPFARKTNPIYLPVTPGGAGRRILVNGDVNTQTPRRSAHTRTSDREFFFREGRGSEPGNSLQASRYEVS